MKFKIIENKEGDYTVKYKGTYGLFWSDMKEEFRGYSKPMVVHFDCVANAKLGIKHFCDVSGVANKLAETLGQYPRVVDTVEC